MDYAAVSDGNITADTQSSSDGQPEAPAQLLELVYGELRRLAAARLAREAPGQTLQPTALVHEAWLRLGGDRQPLWRNKAHFFAAAAESMRRILIDNARKKRAARRGGPHAKFSVEEMGFEPAALEDDPEQVLLINDAIDALALHDARKAEIVKQKYFAGLSLEQSAEALGISPATAKRDWVYARTWLYREVQRLRG